MILEKVYLKEKYNINTDAYIEIMIPYNNDQILRNKSKAIIIVPGGGYQYVSLREKDPVALAYMIEGFIAITLTYSVKTSYPKPMQELAFAIDYLRSNADKYYIDKDKITIIGFSAGGHLVSSYGYIYKNQEFIHSINLDSEEIKPNCIITSYPVITMGEYTHNDTCKTITSGKPELIRLLSVENNIDSTYPPTFIWTTVEDATVPYINSTLYVEALKENNVVHEFFLYPFLRHGLSMLKPILYPLEMLQDNKMKEVSTWFEKSVNFINKVLD